MPAPSALAISRFVVLQTPVRFLEPLDILAYRFNLPSQLHPQHRIPGPQKPKGDPCHGPLPARNIELANSDIPHVHCCRLDFYQHLIVSGRRFFDLPELKHFWRSVSRAYNRFHFGILHSCNLVPSGGFQRPAFPCFDIDAFGQQPEWESHFREEGKSGNLHIKLG